MINIQGNIKYFVEIPSISTGYFFVLGFVNWEPIVSPKICDNIPYVIERFLEIEILCTRLISRYF